MVFYNPNFTPNGGVYVNTNTPSPSDIKPPKLDGFEGVFNRGKQQVTSFFNSFKDSSNNAKKLLEQTELAFKNVERVASSTFSSTVKNVQKFNSSLSATQKIIKTTRTEFISLGKDANTLVKNLGGIATGLFGIFDVVNNLQQGLGILNKGLQAVASASAALGRKDEGLAIAESLGINTTSIQQLDLFQAGLFGNIEAVQQFGLIGASSSAQFQLNLTKLNTILKVSKDDLKDVGEEARNLAKNLGNTVSSKDIVAGQYQIASGGFTKPSDSRAVASSAGTLATVGFSDYFETADLLTKTLRAYNLEADQAAALAAKLNAIVEVGITTVPELAEGFGESAVLAKSFGISIDQLGAALATITTQGSSTPEGLTGIDSLLRSIANQSPQAIKAINQLSLDGQKVKFDLATVQAKGLGAALNDVFKAANGNIEILSDIIPESRALQAALALTANSGQLFADSLDALQNSSPEKLKALAEGVKEDPTIRLQSISRRAEEILSKFGSSVQGFFEPAINSVDAFVSSIEILADNPIVQTVLNTFLTLTTVVKQAVGVFSSLAGGILGIATSLISLNFFNNLFNGGLVKQARLIKTAIFDVKDYGSALKQLVGGGLGVDISGNLAKKSDTRIATLKEQRQIQVAERDAIQTRTPSGETTTALEKARESVSNTITDLSQELRDRSKLNQLGLKQVKSTQNRIRSTSDELFGKEQVDAATGQKVRVGGLQAQLSEAENRLLADPTNTALIKDYQKKLKERNDKIGEIGKLTIEQNTALRSAEKSGLLDTKSAQKIRGKTEGIADSVVNLAESTGQIREAKIASTPTFEIKRRLDQEIGKGEKASPEIISNLSDAYQKSSAGAKILVNAQGQIVNGLQSINKAQTLAVTTSSTFARIWTFATTPFPRVLDSLKGVNRETVALDKAVRLAGASQAVSGFFGSIGSVATNSFEIAKKGATSFFKLGIAGAVSLGQAFASYFFNPLTIGLTLIAGIKGYLDALQRAKELEAENAEAFANAEKIKEDAINKTRKTLQDQNRVKELTAKGFDETTAQRIVDQDRKKSNIKESIDRESRLLSSAQSVKDSDRTSEFDRRNPGSEINQRINALQSNIGRNRQRLASGDTRSANEFLDQETSKLRDRLRATDKENGNKGFIADAAFTTAGAVAGATVFGTVMAGATVAGLIAKGGVIGTALGGVVGTVAGAVIGGIVGLALSLFGQQVIKDIDVNKQKQEIKEETKARRRTELEIKYGLKAELPESEKKRILSKIDKDLNVLDKQIEAEFEKKGINANILQKKADLLNPESKAFDKNLELARSKVEQSREFSNEALLNANNNLVSSSLVGSDLAGKINKSLSTKSKLSSDDVALVTSSLDGQIEAAKAEKAILEKQIKDLGEKPEGENLARKSILEEEIAKQNTNIEILSKAREKTLKNISINNLRAQNLVDNKQGVGVSRTDKSASALSSTFKNIDDALVSTSEDKIKTIDSNLDSLISTIDDLTNLDLTKLDEAKLKLDNLLSLDGDAKGLTLNASQITKIIQTQIKIIQAKAQADIDKLELKSKPLNILALGDTLAATVGQTQQSENELAILQRKYTAQEEIVKLLEKQGSPIEKEKANNDLIAIQLEYKAKLIDTIAQKEINSINERYNREKSLLDLTASRQDISNKLSNDFNLVSIGGNAPSANTALQQAQLDSDKARQELEAKQKAALSRAELTGDKGIIKEVKQKNKEEKQVFETNEKAKLEQAQAEAIRATYADSIKLQQVFTQKLNDSLQSTSEILSRTQDIDETYKTLNASVAAVVQQNQSARILAQDTYRNTLKNLEVQKQALIATGQLTDDAEKELETSKKLAEVKFKDQQIQLDFKVKSESLDAFGKQLQSKFEQSTKKLNITKDALGIITDTLGSDSTQGRNAQKIAAQLNIELAKQQAAIEENLLVVQQKKTEALLNEQKIRLQLLDIELQIKESEAKTPEQKGLITSARSSIKDLQSNLQDQLNQLPDQFEKERSIKRQQSVVSIGGATLSATKEFNPSDLKNSLNDFISAAGNAGVFNNDQIREIQNPSSRPLSNLRTSDAINQLNQLITTSPEQRQQQQRLLQTVQSFNPNSEPLTSSVTDLKKQQQQNNNTNNNRFEVSFNIETTGNSEQDGKKIGEEASKVFQQKMLELSQRLLTTTN